MTVNVLVLVVLLAGLGRMAVKSNALTAANYSVSLPGKAPVALTSANVNFATDALAETTDDDATCTGTAAAPTAPAGKVCLYIYSSTLPGVTSLQGFQANNLGNQAFYVSWTAAGGTDSVFLTWAYTAP